MELKKELKPEMKTVLEAELKAPAKVNWHLAVGHRRPDGYHPISSVFQTCSLCDVINVEIGPGPFTVDVTGLEMLCKKGCSTLDHAAILWHESTGFDRSLAIHVEKHIPSQAGLGGGSSDAASLLLYLNRISASYMKHMETTKHMETMDKAKLMALGAKVGCDVPFFISQCRAAYVTGLGGIVEEIEAREDLKGFIIVPQGEKVSTGSAYAALDRRETIPELESRQELERIYRRPVSQWTFRNDFDMVNTVPEMETSDDEKLLLTGSGSCHILLTEREKLTPTGGMSAIRVSF